MKNLDFKNALNQLKEQKNKVANDNGKKFVRYGDVIKEKIKENKVEKTIFRNFEELENDRDEWYQIRNVSLNKETEYNSRKIEVKDENNIGKNVPSSSNSDFANKERETQCNFLENNDDSSIKRDILEDSNTNPEIYSCELGKADWEDIQTKSNKKEWKITVDPKTIITEINEEGEKKRIINVDNYTSEFKCDELYNWFHVMFINWEKDLDSIPEYLRDSAECRQKFGIYKQCRGYIKPLLRLLKKKEISKEIMNKLFEIMIFCIDKDYIRAHDRYIELAIGNAPWPMGVTMVGIHERSGRARIANSQVAHILNDENTKKYLQSVKRIMSLVQRLNPTSPSQSVVS